MIYDNINLCILTQVWVMPWPSTGKRPICEGTGVGGGIVEGRVRNFWQGEYCKQFNKARPDGEYDLGQFNAN